MAASVWVFAVYRRRQSLDRAQKKFAILRRRALQVANEALDLVFAATPEEELIDRAIEKRLRLHGRPQSRAETKKLFDHLLRQGFAFELIGEKLRTISSVEVDEDV